MNEFITVPHGAQLRCRGRGSGVGEQDLSLLSTAVECVGRNCIGRHRISLW